MSNERKVLAAVLKDREAYEKVAPLVTEGTWTEQARLIWAAVSEFYTRDRDARQCDPDIIHGYVDRQVSSEKHRGTFRSLVGEIAALEVSSANVAEDFLGVRRESAGAKLASALVMNKHDEVRALIEEYEKCGTSTETGVNGNTCEVLRGLPVAEMSKVYSDSELIKVWPQALNQRLDGGLLRGHHLIVFARPEMGKTAFLVNAMAGFASQKLTSLYIGNEDPILDIALRTICRLTKRNKFQVLEQPQESYDLALSLGYEKLVLASLAPGTPREIEGLIQEYKPDVVLIDQIRNLTVNAGKDGNRTNQLEAAATSARNLGKRHEALVVSATQAGDSASGKAILEMGDVDGSNTGIPAQGDVIIGIGATQEDIAMGRRILSLPKNKRSGNHEFFPVRIDPACSRMWSE